MVLRNKVYNNQTYIGWSGAGGNISDGNGIIIDDFRNTQNGSTNGRYTARTLVANNISFNNGGSGIHTYLSDHVDIVNNVAYQNSASPALDYPEIFANDSDDVKILNNILVSRSDGRVTANDRSTNVVFDFNLFSGTRGLPMNLLNNIMGDPGFVFASINPSEANFSPVVGSPGLDKGTSEFAPIDDFNKIIRPQGAGYDIGAFELVLTATPVATSTVAQTATATRTSTPTATATETSTLTATATQTSTPIATVIPTQTSTPTPVATFTSTPVVAPTTGETPAIAPLTWLRVATGLATGFTDSRKRQWIADVGYVDGLTIRRGPISIKSQIPELYRNGRYGMSKYGFKVRNGMYTVVLHFAETFSGINGPGQRVFDLNVEGILVKNLDIYKSAGKKRNKPVIKRYSVLVKDGELSINFISKVQNPFINGIEIFNQTDSSDKDL